MCSQSRPLESESRQTTGAGAGADTGAGDRGQEASPTARVESPVRVVPSGRVARASTAFAEVGEDEAAGAGFDGSEANPS